MNCSYEEFLHRLDESSSSQQDESMYETTAWPIPSAETMSERLEDRRKMLVATQQERVIHHAEGPGLNISQLLIQRESFGSSGPFALRQRKRKTRRRPAGGARPESPSTVFESPVSTAARLFTGQPSHSSEGDDSASRVAVPQYCDATNLKSNFSKYSEWCAATKFHSSFLYHLGGDEAVNSAGERPPSSSAISTIAVAFSPDRKTLASTHGDHSVKISCCITGRLLRRLDGHPRTPWTVKYHPTDPKIVASGCLGHQVRVWNWTTSTLIQMVRLDFAVISLSFHPTGKVLAIANGTRLHFWGVDTTTQSEEEAAQNLVEIDQRHMLRCVHFHPRGDTIITGGVNPPIEDPRRRQRVSSQLSFYLRIWDFDMSIVFQGEPEVGADQLNIARRSISNPRTFVPRALLYNDGGFDVSPDGTKLCVCIEYWLPNDCDNVMDLYHSEQDLFDADQVNEEENRRLRDLRENEGLEIPSDVTGQDPGMTPRSLSPGDGKRSTRTSERQNSCTSIEPSPPLADFSPRTPEVSRQDTSSQRLSPPSPPARRFTFINNYPQEPPGGQPAVGTNRGFSTPPPAPPGGPPSAPGLTMRPPHPLSVVSGLSTSTPEGGMRAGRYVPHVAVISLDTSPIPADLHAEVSHGGSYGAFARGYRPRIGQLLEAHPLDENKASAITCVKYSPSADYLLVGYGVREQGVTSNVHPVTAIYRVDGGMKLVSTMLSGDDDVNIARFHPDVGHGFVYGTKQGRIRVLSPHPWMYYYQ